VGAGDGTGQLKAITDRCGKPGVETKVSSPGPPQPGRNAGHQDRQALGGQRGSGRQPGADVPHVYDQFLHDLHEQRPHGDGTHRWPKGTGLVSVLWGEFC
jgi:hypothetical protein